MDIEKQKKIDGFLNPTFKIMHLLGYVGVVIFFAGIGTLLDLFILGVLNISFETMPILDSIFLLKSIAFFVITCIPIIVAISLIISAFVNKTKAITNNTDIDSTDNDVLYDFIYELIDNVFKCLTFFGVFFQIVSNIKSLTSPNPTEQTNRIAILVVFSLIMGIQQFIFKCWFKTIRKFGDENFFQWVYLIKSYRKTKKNLKKIINCFDEINFRVKGNGKKEKKELEDSIDIIFGFFNKDDNIELLGKFYKTKPIIDIINSKEFADIKKKFLGSTDKSGIRREDIKEQFDKIKQYL